MTLPLFEDQNLRDNRVRFYTSIKNLKTEKNNGLPLLENAGVSGFVTLNAHLYCFKIFSEKKKNFGRGRQRCRNGYPAKNLQNFVLGGLSSCETQTYRPPKELLANFNVSHYLKKWVLKPSF